MLHCKIFCVQCGGDVWHEDGQTASGCPQAAFHFGWADARIEEMAALCPIKKDAAPLRQEKTKKKQEREERKEGGKRKMKEKRGEMY